MVSHGHVGSNTCIKQVSWFNAKHVHRDLKTQNTLSITLYVWIKMYILITYRHYCPIVSGFAAKYPCQLPFGKTSYYGWRCILTRSSQHVQGSLSTYENQSQTFEHITHHSWWWIYLLRTMLGVPAPWLVQVWGVNASDWPVLSMHTLTTNNQRYIQQYVSQTYTVCQENVPRCAISKKAVC